MGDARDGCQSYSAAVLHVKGCGRSQTGTWELTVLWRIGVQVTLKCAKMNKNKLSSLIQKPLENTVLKIDGGSLRGRESAVNKHSE